MKRLLAGFGCFLTLVLLLVLPSMALTEDELVEKLVQVRSEPKPIEVLPSQAWSGFNLDRAYDVQKRLVGALTAKDERIGGFKAGLTTQPTQKRFGLDCAVFAPMLKSGELPDGTTLQSKDFVKLFVETEVGYVIGEKIDAPVKDMAALKKMVKEVFPAIEFPDIRFADLKGLTGLDIVADAVGASKYLVGKKVAADTVDVAQVSVTLKLDGEEVNVGKAADALGDQWQALLWLVNTAVERGYVIEPGNVFITGALGKMIPGKPGKYQGDYGPLGSLSFTIQ
jgi:2-keto-4-pentenoate hydratase